MERNVRVKCRVSRVESGRALWSVLASDWPTVPLKKERPPTKQVSRPRRVPSEEAGAADARHSFYTSGHDTPDVYNPTSCYLSLLRFADSTQHRAVSQRRKALERRSQARSRGCCRFISVATLRQQPHHGGTRLGQHHLTCSNDSRDTERS